MKAQGKGKTEEDGEKREERRKVWQMAAAASDESLNRKEAKEKGRKSAFLPFPRQPASSWSLLLLLSLLFKGFPVLPLPPLPPLPSITISSHVFSKRRPSQPARGRKARGRKTGVPSQSQQKLPMSCFDCQAISTHGNAYSSKTAEERRGRLGSWECVNRSGKCDVTRAAEKQTPVRDRGWERKRKRKLPSSTFLPPIK